VDMMQDSCCYTRVSLETALSAISSSAPLRLAVVTRSPMRGETRQLLSLFSATALTSISLPLSINDLSSPGDCSVGGFLDSSDSPAIFLYIGPLSTGNSDSQLISGNVTSIVQAKISRVHLSRRLWLLNVNATMKVNPIARAF